MEIDFTFILISLAPFGSFIGFMLTIWHFLIGRSWAQIEEIERKYEFDFVNKRLTEFLSEHGFGRDARLRDFSKLKPYLTFLEEHKENKKQIGVHQIHFLILIIISFLMINFYYIQIQFPVAYPWMRTIFSGTLIFVFTLTAVKVWGYIASVWQLKKNIDRMQEELNGEESIYALKR